MERNASQRGSLLGFFLVAYAVTWSCWLLIGAAHVWRLHLPLPPERLGILGQFGPFLAAVLCTSREQGLGGLRDLARRLVRWRVSPGWIAAALLFPPLAILAAVRLHALLGGSASMPVQNWDPEAVLLGFPFVLLTGGPLGEELGWRGYALPRLQHRWGAVSGSVLLGLLWAGWHLPLWWIAHVPPLGWYWACMVPLTYLFTIVSNRTRGSVLVAMLLHTSLNTCVLRLPSFVVFPEWTVILWAVAIAAYFGTRDSATGPGLGRRGELQPPMDAETAPAG